MAKIKVDVRNNHIKSMLQGAGFALLFQVVVGMLVFFWMESDKQSHSTSEMKSEFFNTTNVIKDETLIGTEANASALFERVIGEFFSDLYIMNGVDEKVFNVTKSLIKYSTLDKDKNKFYPEKQQSNSLGKVSIKEKKEMSVDEFDLEVGRIVGSDKQVMNYTNEEIVVSLDIEEQFVRAGGISDLKKEEKKYSAASLNNLKSLPIATFSKASNFLKMKAKLKDMGIRYYIKEFFGSDERKLYQVLAGPSYGDFTEVRERIEKEFNLKTGNSRTYKK